MHPCREIERKNEGYREKVKSAENDIVRKRCTMRLTENTPDQHWPGGDRLMANGRSIAISLKAAVVSRQVQSREQIRQSLSLSERGKSERKTPIDYSLHINKTDAIIKHTEDLILI